MPSRPLDWVGMAVDELRDRADAGSIAAMEELARRLVQGIGMPKDPKAGAAWLIRAAQSGSPQSAFNVAVMYERGFMLERSFAKAIEWYRRAVEGDLAMAKHNLALLLRDGKGAARDGTQAIELLRSAARQGMAASMFSLGDIYERGEATPKDAPAAMAWFAIAAEFERQANKGAETALAKTSATRALALQQGSTQEDLQKAEEIGQREFRRIVEAIQRPARPQLRLTPLPPTEVATAIPPPAPPRRGALPPLPPPDLDPPDWPKASKDQIRMIQNALFDLKLLRDKPDGSLGPMTRAAIRTFQRINAQRETGEPTKELYASLKEAVARHDPAPPPRPETKPEPPIAIASARPETPKPIVLAATLPPPPPPTSADIKKLMPPPPGPPKPIKLAATVAPPPPPTSADIKKLMPPPPAPPKPIVLAAAETTPPPSSDDITRLMPAPAPKPIELAAAETTPPPSSGDIARLMPPPAKPIQLAATLPPPPPPTSADIKKLMPPPTAPPKPIVLAATLPPPPPPTSADIRKATPVDPDAWPATPTAQVKAIQALLREMRFYESAPDGRIGRATRAAIREYEGLAGLEVTGKPSRELFESLKEMQLLMKPRPRDGSN